MKDDLEKTLMEIGEPFTKDEVAEMMAVACDPITKKVYYEYYINLLIVCMIIFTLNSFHDWHFLYQLQ